MRMMRARRYWRSPPFGSISRMRWPIDAVRVVIEVRARRRDAVDEPALDERDDARLVKARGRHRPAEREKDARVVARASLHELERRSLLAADVRRERARDDVRRLFAAGDAHGVNVALLLEPFAEASLRHDRDASFSGPSALPSSHPCRGRKMRSNARMMGSSRWEALAASETIDVALGAALIARDAYAALDVPKLLARFDELAAPLAHAGLEKLSAVDAATALSHHLYATLGFSGNEGDYYDPRNSLLSDVLERKSGIPISLALVYCEVARRAGVRAEGVSFPGHFLVRVFGAERSEAIVDPFYDGRVLDEPALEKLLERVAGQASAPSARVTAEMTAAASPRAFLTRWLLNLRGVYLARGDLSRALLVVDRLVSLNPRDRALLRDRGMLAAKLGATSQAREDLSRALALAPANEAEELRAALAKLGEKPSAAN